MPQTAPVIRSALRRSSFRRKAAAVVAAAGMAVPFAASALPVFPGAQGFGTDTPAGRGGKVIRVTNLNTSGAGSLKACVDASGPRVCVFEVSGTIKANADLVIRNPNITIAGQTAPSPGIMYRGGGLWVKASDVLVQHIRFRPGDDANGPAFGNRDALKISIAKPDVVRNIVIDHCTFAWAVDETASAMNGWDNITLSNNIFAEPLDQSHHPEGRHGYGIIIGETDGHITLVGNLMAHQVERNPLSRAKESVIVNNVVYNRANMDIDLQNKAGLSSNTVIVGNVFIRGADHARDTKPVHIRTSGIQALESKSKVYVSDNEFGGKVPEDDWSIAGVSSGSLPASLKSKQPITWPAGFTRLPSDIVLNEVLRSAGARPADRDPPDARVVREVREGKGRIINCVANDGSTRCARNAGGWPKLAENRRPLTIPSNPSAVTKSGYTNLEVWLHEMAAEVEGRSSVLPGAPMLSSQN